MFDIRFVNHEDILRRMVIIPNPDGVIGYGQHETRAIFLKKEAPDHFFIVVDPERFMYPKPIDCDKTYYYRMSSDNLSTRPPGANIPVFLSPDMHREKHETFGMEAAPVKNKRKAKGAEILLGGAQAVAADDEQSKTSNGDSDAPTEDDMSGLESGNEDDYAYRTLKKIRSSLN